MVPRRALDRRRPVGRAASRWDLGGEPRRRPAAPPRPRTRAPRLDGL